MEFGSLFAMLVIGGVAGWLSGKLMKGRGFGLLGNIIIVGILGAFVAGLIVPALGFSVGGGIVASILHATIGAVILLSVTRSQTPGNSLRSPPMSAFLAMRS